jgi:hypothetical protein
VTSETQPQVEQLGKRPLSGVSWLGQLELDVVKQRHYGEMWAPNTFVEFAATIDRLAWQSAGGWRGQADIDWRLDSSAVRRLREPRPEVDPLGMPPEYLESVVAEYEQRLLNHARMAGHGQRGGRDLADLELLAVLQHHGAATRLLDFTRNVWTAAWFAATESPDRWGLVFGLDLNEAFVIRDVTTLRRPISDLLEEAADRISIWRPAALSPRMPAQHAFLLWAKAEFRPWGSIGAPPLSDATERPVSKHLPGFVCVAVGPSLKRELASHWKRLFGYSIETLFPDLDGFARANHWTADLGDLSPWAPPEGEVEPEPPDEPLPDDDDDEWGFE